MTPTESPPPKRSGLTRRGALISAGTTLGAGLATGGYALGRSTRADHATEIPFYGRHQAGIADPPQAALCFAAFDLTTETASDLQQLLRSWSSVAARLCSGRNAGSDFLGATRRPDPGEADGLDTASLSVTFGLGPALFELNGEDRLGLRNAKPAALDQLPPLPGDELQTERSHGDLCVQACADDPQVAFHAIHSLTFAGHGTVAPRWAQTGFLPSQTTPDPSSTPRNLMGFKDGTNNLRVDDANAMRRHVWVSRPDLPSWMRDGTYLVARRVRMLLDVWDGLPVAEQERIIGRHKQTGAPLGTRTESDRVDLTQTDAGASVIPADAHIRLAAASSNRGARILRRGYSYNDGIDQTTGQIDAGLFFICFQRHPHRQFGAIQRRLGANDALAKHLSHTSSAVFACPPGTRPGSYVGEYLFAGTR